MVVPEVVSKLATTHRGWYSRGYLPHYDAATVQFITFRLVDALPRKVIDSWTQELAGLTDQQRERDEWKRVHTYLDSGRGACWLRDARIAEIVETTFLHHDGDRYRLLGWTVMPNHVHVLAELGGTASLPSVVKGWKGYSAREANRLLDRSGPFWFREYHDRYIRDGDHLRNAIRYIDDNPVKAGLCREASSWPFGSARFETLPPVGQPAVPVGADC